MELTESQARKIIGEKMVARIDFLNDWMKKNGYYVMLHSTYKSNVPGIFSEEGLHYPVYETTNSKNEILEDCAIRERDLDRLENWIKTKHINAEFETPFETMLPGRSSTTVRSSQLSAKQLLEYSHLGGDTTIIFCVPRKTEMKRVGRVSEDEFRVSMREYDPYLRRKIRGYLQENGTVEFESRFFYPMEGMLFAFDREEIKVKFNEKFDETYYLDDTTPQKGKIQKGEVLQGLRSLNQQIGKTESSGRTR